MLEDGKPPLTIIDESYNANPASMLAAFKVFEMVNPVEGGRRIAVLGDMLELGKDGPRLHAELANPLLRAKTDLLFCCGPQMDALYQALPEPWRGGHADDSRALAKKLLEAVKPGDVLLIAGEASSHCVRSTTEHIVQHLPRLVPGWQASRIVLLTDGMSPVAGFEAQHQAFLDAMRAAGAQLGNMSEIGL